MGPLLLENSYCNTGVKLGQRGQRCNVGRLAVQAIVPRSKRQTAGTPITDW